MIEIYTKPGNTCAYCVKAKSLLESQGIAYKEHIIGIHILRESFLNLFPDAETVPQIVDDGVRIGGYTELVEHLANIPPTTSELLQG